MTITNFKIIAVSDKKKVRSCIFFMDSCCLIKLTEKLQAAFSHGKLLPDQAQMLKDCCSHWPGPQHLTASIHYHTQSYNQAGCLTSDTEVWWPLLSRLKTVSDGSPSLGDGHCWWAHYNRCADTGIVADSARIGSIILRARTNEKELRILILSAFMGWCLWCYEEEY